VGWGFYISTYWIYISGITLADYTSILKSDKPVTCSGVNYSWGASVTNSCVEILSQTAVANSFGETVAYSILNCLYNLGDQLLVCSLPWYMHFYRPLLSCNNSPLFWLSRLFCLQNSWDEFSCIRRYIIRMNYVSVAWQWLSSTLDNSTLQTTSQYNGDVMSVLSSACFISETMDCDICYLVNTPHKFNLGLHQSGMVIKCDKTKSVRSKGKPDIKSVCVPLVTIIMWTELI
jgi:hypothetical protein